MEQVSKLIFTWLNIHILLMILDLNFSYELIVKSNSLLAIDYRFLEGKIFPAWLSTGKYTNMAKSSWPHWLNTNCAKFEKFCQETRIVRPHN